MAEPIRPTDESDDQGRHVAERPLDAPPEGSAAEVDEQAAARRDLGESAAAEAQPAAAGDEPVKDVAAPAAAAPRAETAVEDTRTTAYEPVQETPTTAYEPPVEYTRTTAYEPVQDARSTTEAPVEDTRTTAYEPVGRDDTSVAAPVEPAAATGIQPPPDFVPVPPASAQQTIAPAADYAPPPPRRRGNRLAGTAWVLLAAGLFQVFYFLSVSLLIDVFAGPAAIVPQVSALVQARWGVFGWLPVLFLFLLFELAVLIAGRAGRFFWVVASGVIGVLDYALSVVLISVVVRGAMPDTNTLAQTFLNPTFILIGVVAREVVLWTGFAVGARGLRIRRRDREDRERYDRELAEHPA